MFIKKKSDCICVAYANINIQLNVHVLICFRVTPKTKIDFVKNQFFVKILVFRILLGILPSIAPTRFTFPSKKILKLKIEA